MVCREVSFDEMQGFEKNHGGAYSLKKVKGFRGGGGKLGQPLAP